MAVLAVRVLYLILAVILIVKAVSDEQYGLAAIAAAIVFHAIEVSR